LGFKTYGSSAASFFSSFLTAADAAFFGGAAVFFSSSFLAGLPFSFLGDAAFFSSFVFLPLGSSALRWRFFPASRTLAFFSPFVAFFSTEVDF